MCLLQPSNLLRSNYGEANVLGILKEIASGLNRMARMLCSLVLFLPTLAAAQTRVWHWTLGDVDVQGVGSSIISDRDGNLHVSYYFPSGGQLKYGFRPAGGSTWYKMTLESGLNSADTSITLDPEGNPQICSTPNSIRYARWNGKTWSTQEVDPGSGRIAFICSIQVSRDGAPMITWYLESGTYLRYAILQDGAWRASSIDGGESMPGKWNSMVLDPKELPQVAYSEWPIGQLKYARFDGKQWHISLIDAPDIKHYSGGQRGMGNSLTFDANGNPLISYYDEDSLRLARLVDGHWKIETVEKIPALGKWGWASVRSKVLLDSKGNPHIGFESRLGLEHAWWDGKVWRSQLLVSVVGEPHLENSMAMDRDDNIYITFRDPGDGTLKMATGRPAMVAESASGTATP
jgi:hypothetical protein